MPLFVSDEEFSRLRNDPVSVADKADAFIRDLQKELDTVRAQADAASITAEQTCALLEQKYISLSNDFSQLQSQNTQLQSSLDQCHSELAQIQAQKHQFHLQSIEKDGEIERLTTEVTELHKSKRQLIELVEQKDMEISEKNATIKSYLDKIVNLSDTAAEREARVSETEAELARSQTACARLSQEKELIERHNAWINEELTGKVNELLGLRRKLADIEADMSSKNADLERQYNECSSSLKWNKERVTELQLKTTSLQEELRQAKEAASAKEEQFSAELSTVNKLVELYKESSEEWSKKAGELEGVIKALETHLSQVESDYKERLEKEVSLRTQFEKEAADLKVKLEKCEAEVEKSRKANELNILPLSNFASETWMNSIETIDMAENDRAIVPRIPAGVSGTALAASLLRDGWSLAKMYEKYQEAVDAMRHEQFGRKESEAVLQRVLHELEQKGGLILDEREEHERMVEAYSLINQRLQNSISEQENLEKTIQELKADIRRRERDYNLALKENADLQKQVTVLLKECRDIQIRCGSAEPDNVDDYSSIVPFEMNVDSDAEKVISQRLLTFKDINGLVEQNAQLRSLVRSLTDQIKNRESEFMEKFEMELKKHTDEAASRVAAVLQRAEEQGRMIESLHTSVAMYKRLYEEEQRLHLTPHSTEVAPGDGRKDLKLLLEGSQEATRKAQEKAAERVKRLQEELEKSRNEVLSLRAERDKMTLEANFARERLDSFMKEFEHQRTEKNGVLARNVEFSQLVIDYQRKLRENSESVHAAEELSRKLNMDVSFLKHEKEMLINAEKRALDEVRSLSERVYRLQASLDTIQSAEQVREEARIAERKKQEEYTKQIQRDWAEARKELQAERDNVRALTLDREQTNKNAMRQLEEMGKDLANALHAVSAAETRAALAETKLSDLEKRLKSSDVQAIEMDGTCGSSSLSSSKVVTDLQSSKEEIEKLKLEARANKEHMLQYKSIAQVNEDALKQMECAHENFKTEAEKLKRSMEAELVSLREKVSELESESCLKSEEVASAAAGKEEALSSAIAEITSLKEETSAKASRIVEMEIHVSALKENLETEHQRWRTAQTNYERQVILQSETIQELNKTSQALSLLQEENSELRKLVGAQKSEINELKSKWEIEKKTLEESKNDAEKKYIELNEQNKILHSRLEALHIQLAEKDRFSSGLSGGSADPNTPTDAGLQNVISYLRRSKEIAETEISLLKQEKLRLQSQLESALKASENAQSSLSAERASSKSLLFTEEEIKSLQLQVREMNLLRESNIQLREENKHNFEECQKLREVAHKANAQTENLERLLKERQIELEACKKEIEMQKLEKENLEKRVSELLERCGNINVEEYDCLKSDVPLMKDKLKQKDSEIEEFKKLLLEKQETVSRLEQDLSNRRLELSDREKRINDMQQVEASLKSDVEKHKRIIIQLKRRLESFSKEKEELNKENQALTRQLEEVKQAKKSVGDTAGEQAMKEEKDTKIQILEKHLERQREELRKEKEENKTERARRLKNEKAVKDSYNNVEQEKARFVSELEKYKQTLKRLLDELEKLKQAKESISLPEGSSAARQLSGGASLDDLSNAYFLAVETFEKAACAVSGELGAPSVTTDTPVAETTTAAAAAAPSQIPTSSVGPPATSHPSKSAEESERRIASLRSNIETRQKTRRLVRPRLARPEEPQGGDAEMPELEGPNNGGKPAPSNETEAQGTSQPVPQPLLRKRQASPSPSGSHEESAAQGETGADVAAPLLKKVKGSDSPKRSGDGQSSAALENVEPLPVPEDSSDVADLPQGSTEEAIIDAEKEEVEATEEKLEEPKEPQLDSTAQVESQNDNNVLEEDTEKAGEMVTDDGGQDQADLENQQSMMDIGGDREEGEFEPDTAEGDGTGDLAGSPELGEVQESAATPVASPARVDDEAVASAMDVGDINLNEPQDDDINEEVDVPDETAEGSDKSNDGNDPTPSEIDQAPEAPLGVPESTETEVPKQAGPSIITTETEVPKQASPSVTTTGTSVPKQASSRGSTAESSVPRQASPSVSAETEEVKQVSPIGSSSVSTTINLSERARQRAMLRQAGVVSSPSPSRGRGRAAPRARGVRGRGRSGRGQMPGEQS